MHQWNSPRNVICFHMKPNKVTIFIEKIVFIFYYTTETKYAHTKAIVPAYTQLKSTSYRHHVLSSTICQLKFSPSLFLSTSRHPFFPKDQLKLYMFQKPKATETIPLPQCIYCLWSSSSQLVSHFRILLCIVLRLLHICVISSPIGFKFIIQRCIHIFYFSLLLCLGCISHSNLVICYCHM